MLFLLTATIALAQDDLSTDDILMHVPNSGYSVENRYHDADHMINFRRTADHAGLSAELAHAWQGVDREVFWRRWTIIQDAEDWRNRPSTAPSGFPIGDRSTYYASPGSFCLYSMLENVTIKVGTQYRGTGPRGDTTWHNSDPEGDKALVEGLARNALAKTFGRRLSAAPNQIVNGITITNCMRTATGVIMAPLGQWAAARGISLNENERLGTFSFNHSGRAYIVPLAAKSIKKGANWEDIAAPVLKSDGSTYIPLQSMQNIVGEICGRGRAAPSCNLPNGGV